METMKLFYSIFQLTLTCAYSRKDKKKGKSTVTPLYFTQQSLKHDESPPTDQPPSFDTFGFLLCSSIETLDLFVKHNSILNIILSITFIN
ncbi:unnamed protein product [Rotaria socialis]